MSKTQVIAEELEALGVSDLAQQVLAVAKQGTILTGNHFDTGEEFLTYLKGLGEDQVKKLIQAGEDNTLFPSGWAHFKTPYPVFLAKILVQTKHAESWSDIANIYYHKDRKLEPEAQKVFKAAALADPLKDIQCSGGMGLGPHQIVALITNEPDFLKKLLIGASDKNLDKIVHDVEEAENGQTTPAVKKIKAFIENLR